CFVHIELLFFLLSVVALILLSVVAASDRVLRLGKCPQPAVQANFDADRYEIQKFPTSFQKGQCATANYSKKCLTKINFCFVFYFIRDDGTINSIVGSARVKDPTEPSKLEVSFNSKDISTPPYWVLSTDYSHSLVYGLFHMELSWILSREPTLSKETPEELHSILCSVGVSMDNLVPTNQDETYCGPMNQ
uniref:Apolipoprotein D n=1 Tax=Amphilophus citrinellus TaxID=61819 RepID=A0A3Q0RFB4_AMPCI